ncbi:MAG: hypothetical protein QOF84_2253 [Streptomyces sp.]|jgi:hypothetical protein|uniref:hypothetical protein n=1 Tax=Actinacidiphila soli TaxID=2487275 RepID=UPI000FCAEFFF|nr:hypothetical protein [Actinacidiphila soli]MDX6311652.1 hypothetical protein [Streptomyces sp.]MDX6347463.1 hypothetical protein [Streptomyces sp.]
MGQDGLKAATDVLDTEGNSFKKMSESFGNAVDRLRNGLTTLEQGDTPPWGDDDIGEKFGVVYEGVRDGMYQSMDFLTTRLDDIGKALQDMGKNHDSNETFNNALIQQEQSHADAQGQLLKQLVPPTSI